MAQATGELLQRVPKRDDCKIGAFPGWDLGTMSVATWLTAGLVTATHLVTLIDGPWNISNNPARKRAKPAYAWAGEQRNERTSRAAPDGSELSKGCCAHFTLRFVLGYNYSRPRYHDVMLLNLDS